MPPRVSLFITGAFATVGGIANVNRTLIDALGELVLQGRFSLRIHSLHESLSGRPSHLLNQIDFIGHRGNKISLTSAMWRDALRSRVMIFDLVTLALPILPLARLGIVKTVVFAHGPEAWGDVRRTSKWSFQSAAMTLTNSNFTLHRMQAMLTGFNGVSNPLGLSADFHINNELPPESQSSPTISFTNSFGDVARLSQRYFLIVGRMDSRERAKGMLELISVLPQLTPEFPDVQLVLVGDGDDRDYLTAHAQRSGAGDRILFTGYVDIATLELLYRHCYAFTMPSRQEGFGLVYLEAMNFAKPCLGCRNDGAEEVIIDGHTGILVNNPPTLCCLYKALVRLLSDPSYCRALGTAGFKRLHAEFTTDHMRQRLQKNVATVLNGRDGCPGSN